MAGRLLQLCGKATWRDVKRQVRTHRIESGIALGLLGAAVTANAVYHSHQQKTAMRGKIVVIVGGSRGLGLEIARQFGLAGAHLVLVARKQDELRSAIGMLLQEQAIPNENAAHFVVADISKPEDCQRIISDATERYGRVDVLVNCAAVMMVAPMLDMTAEEFDKAMRVNFFGALHTIQAVLPQMTQRRSGHIVNIASVGGKIAVPHMLPYVASKFALVGLSEGLHAEARHLGVRVTTVCPGLMRTGAHVQVEFAGDAEKEYRWFALGATMPGISIAARAAARQIFNATVAGKAEITITPQAWLGARLVGLAPNASQWFAAAVSKLVLPEANGNKESVSGIELEKKYGGPLRSWSDHLLKAHNQTFV